MEYPRRMRKKSPPFRSEFVTRLSRNTLKNDASGLSKAKRGRTGGPFQLANGPASAETVKTLSGMMPNMVNGAAPPLISIGYPAIQFQLTCSLRYLDVRIDTRSL